MSRFTILLLTFLSTKYPQYSCLQEDYYWRDYTGGIPKDAVIGGHDINGKEIYIGQAYVKGEGLVVSQIYPDVKEVYAPMRGVKKIDTNIKILCGVQYNFVWSPANSTHLHLLLIDKHAVIGGHEDGGGMLNIGRISHEGETKIGKITSFLTENALFYFSNKGKEQSVRSYEILLFKDNSVDVRMN